MIAPAAGASTRGGGVVPDDGVTIVVGGNVAPTTVIGTERTSCPATGSGPSETTEWAPDAVPDGIVTSVEKVPSGAVVTVVR